MSNILIYNINEPYGLQGGMERVTDTLIRMLQRAGHRVSVLCRYPNRMKAAYHCPCPLYYLPEHLSPADYLQQLLDELQPDIIIDQEEGGIIGRHGFFSGREKLQQKVPRIIAVQHSSALSALRHYKQVRKKRIPNAFLSALYHGPFLSLMKLRAQWMKKKDFAELNRHYDRIVTLSHAAVDEFQELCPRCDKLTVIPNCTHYPTPEIRERKKRHVLFVGRMENMSKGVDRLIRIWSETEKTCPDWHLHLLGDGPDLDFNRNLAARLGAERCHFHGCTDPTPFYRESAVICLTSTYEGFGMVLLEGMQHGCIPMAFDSYPAVRELILHRQSGLVVPAFDEAAYSRELAELLQHEELRDKLSKGAERYAQAFSPQRICRKWEQLFSELAV